jgi:uncharacterized protein YndB with AHSA1/START domain
MKRSTKKLELKFERTIAAPPEEVYDAWLGRDVPGTPWSEGEKLILNPEVDGLFYWLVSGTAHYGRFTAVKRPNRVQHTWVSPYTLGEESIVTVTFQKKGDDTLMTLVHSDLPDSEEGRAHDEGWKHFLDLFPQQFVGNPGKERTARAGA